MTKLIMGFSGIGKTYLTNTDSRGHKIIEIDLRELHYKHNKRDDKQFTEDFFNIFNRYKEEYELILVPLDFHLMDELFKRNIYYYLVYPEKELKEEYLKRYSHSPEFKLVKKLLEKEWNYVIKMCKGRLFPYKIQMHKGEYLSDLIHSIYYNEFFGS